MKYVARLRFNIVDGLLVEEQREHCVLLPAIQEPSVVSELSEKAKQYTYDHVEVDRLVNGQRVILLLAGTLQHIPIPKHNDWVIDLSIEWSSLEIIPLVPIKGIDDV